MTLTIVIPSELETRLKEVAARSGMDEAEWARRAIEQSLPAAPNFDQATLDLLAKWDEEDQTSDPAELSRRQNEWEQFRDAMNEDSLSGRRVYP